MSATEILNKIPELNYSEPAVATSIEEFEKVVRSRRSVRVYTDESISDEVVHKCIDMALLAPNSSNLQPWEFYYVKSTEKREKLIEYCLNQPAAKTSSALIIAVARRDTWKRNAQKMLKFFETQENVPKSASIYYSKIVPLAYGQGPLGLFGVIKRVFLFFQGFSKATPRGPASKADMRVWAQKSTALACENLMLAFRASGYDSCPMEGMDPVKVRKLLGLGPQAEVCMVISAGKRASNGVYGPQIRFAREDFVKEV